MNEEYYELQHSGEELDQAISYYLAGGGSQQVQADYEQNNSVKPDYIKNRPFYENNVSITLPEDPSNSVMVQSQRFNGLGISFVFVKVSDSYFDSIEEVLGATAKLDVNGKSVEITIDSNDIVSLTNGFGIMAQRSDGVFPFLINAKTLVDGDVVFPTAEVYGEDIILNFNEIVTETESGTGLYFLYIPGMAVVNSYENLILKQLDEKFIPNIFVKSSEKGKENGVATLDGEGKIPESQIPDDLKNNNGEAVQEVLFVTSDFSFATLEVSNIFPTYDEVLKALMEKKIVKIAVNYTLPGIAGQNVAIGEATAIMLSQNTIKFSLFITANLGAGEQLYQFEVNYKPTSTTTVIRLIQTS